MPKFYIRIVQTVFKRLQSVINKIIKQTLLAVVLNVNICKQNKVNDDRSHEKIILCLFEWGLEIVSRSLKRQLTSEGFGQVFWQAKIICIRTVRVTLGIANQYQQL